MLGVEQIKKAYEKKLDDNIWEMWLVEFPHMDKKTFLTFGDYKKKLLHKKEKQTDEQMLSMVKMLNAAYGGQVVEVYDS